LTHGTHGAFGVRRLVADFNGLVLPHTGSLLPGLPRCACSQALVSPENGSKLPLPGQNAISRAATSRRTPDGAGPYKGGRFAAMFCFDLGESPG